jgi:peptide deformylase
MRLQIFTDDDPILRGSSVAVEKVDTKLNKLALEMVETMAFHNGIGLAAPQVGQKIRLIVFDTSFSEDDGRMAIMFNPEILHGEGTVSLPEKCLSLPGKCVKIARYKKVKIKYLNTRNEKCIVELTGLAAIVVQHEIDHLEGILLTDYEEN